MSLSTITPQQALNAIQRNRLTLLDIRQPHEQLQGMVEGSIAVLPEALKDWCNQNEEIELGLICQRGVRSERLCQTLSSTFDRVVSVQGGIEAWLDADLPLVRPDSRLDAAEVQRYRAQLALPAIGIEGQVRLKRSRVLVIGAGGLGCPAAMYLAAAGVGHLSIVDHDRVELSNLQRQVLHSIERLGVNKALSAQQRLSGLNDQIRIEAHPMRADSASIRTLVDRHDLIVDGSDNYATRYLVNQACLKAAKPLVYGAVEQFAGQLSLFDFSVRQPHSSPCYECLFPAHEHAGEAPSCSERGVLGALPGLIGCMQAIETIKWLSNVGESLCGRLLTVNAMTMQFRETRLDRDPACSACAQNIR